ncbi:MAG: DNA adenine methylase [Armatimonadota bacterium]
MRKRLTEVVNVASVPLRSPFRYPGGKTWAIPRVRQWLRSVPQRSRRTFVEPFAGGAIIGLTVAFESLAEEVILVELDDNVASVWQTILNGEGEWLVQQIADFEMTRDAVRRVLRNAERSTRNRAFATVVENRVNRGGILAPGAGKMKNGENGNGIGSRWYPDTLCRRIREIMARRDRIRFIHGDGFEVMERHLAAPESAYFIDPPYTVAGRRLYRHSEVDHEYLFRLAAMARGPFLMTYDHSEEILALAEAHDFDVAEVAMKTTHHTEKMELFISRDLSWAVEATLPL